MDPLSSVLAACTAIRPYLCPSIDACFIRPVESMCIAPHIGCLIFSVVSFGAGFLFCFPSAQASHVISASVGSGIVRRNSRPVARFLSAISFSLVRLTWPAAQCVLSTSCCML
jgi:hypothetical protein